MVSFIFVTTQELCQSTCISEHCLVEIVEHGIVQPYGDSPQDWSFDTNALTLIKKAVRLQHDLEMDWATTALILNLLKKVEYLENENTHLRQRLERLESPYIEEC